MTDILARTLAYAALEAAKSIGPISGWEVVENLPHEGEPNKLYFIPKLDPITPDAHDEYAWVNNQWEKVGSTDVDISGKMDKVNPSGSGTFNFDGDAVFTGDVEDGEGNVLSEVKAVANPTLEGTEDPLTSIQIGNTKFKMSGGSDNFIEDITNKFTIDTTIHVDSSNFKYRITRIGTFIHLQVRFLLKRSCPEGTMFASGFPRCKAIDANQELTYYSFIGEEVIVQDDSFGRLILKKMGNYSTSSLVSVGFTAFYEPQTLPS